MKKYFFTKWRIGVYVALSVANDSLCGRETLTDGDPHILSSISIVWKQKKMILLIHVHVSTK